MRVLVAGGCGYIGSVVAESLLTAGHEVVVYDSLVTGHRSAVPEAAVFVRGDLADAEALDNLFSRYDFDAVMHFAAFIQAGESMEKPGLYFQNNVCNSLRLIEKVAQRGVKRFVFSSTAAVYGEPKDGLISEDDPLAPANTYGETKLMIERMLHWYGEIYGLRYAALRYFNAAGAAGARGEDHLPETHLIPLVLQVPLGKREHIRIYGSDYPTPDGTCIRDFIHVTDLVTAHMLALAPGITGFYNLGNGEGYSVRQVIRACEVVTGRKIPAVERPRRPGDPPRLVASAEKVARDLGWKPACPLIEDIVASAWAWHQKHPNGYPD